MLTKEEPAYNLVNLEDLLSPICVSYTFKISFLIRGITGFLPVTSYLERWLNYLPTKYH